MSSARWWVVLTDRPHSGQGSTQLLRAISIAYGLGGIAIALDGLVLSAPGEVHVKSLDLTQGLVAEHPLVAPLLDVGQTSRSIHDSKHNTRSAG